MSQYWEEPTGATQHVLLSEAQAHCQSPAVHSKQSPVPTLSSSKKVGDHPYLAAIICLLNDLGFEVPFDQSSAYTHSLTHTLYSINFR